MSLSLKEPDWEVIDEPSKRIHTDSIASKDEQTGFIRSSSDLHDNRPKDPSKSQFYLAIDETSEYFDSHLF